MENEISEAAHHERIWRRRSIWQARRRFDSMERGIPGRPLPPHSENVKADPFPARHIAVDPDGFSLAPQAPAGHSGLSQSQGIDLGPWREEKGFLCAAGVLSRAGGAAR